MINKQGPNTTTVQTCRRQLLCRTSNRQQQWQLQQQHQWRAVVAVAVAVQTLLLLRPSPGTQHHQRQQRHRAYACQCRKQASWCWTGRLTARPALLLLSLASSTVCLCTSCSTHLGSSGQFHTLLLLWRPGLIMNSGEGQRYCCLTISVVCYCLHAYAEQGSSAAAEADAKKNADMPRSG